MVAIKVSDVDGAKVASGLIKGGNKGGYKN